MLVKSTANRLVGLEGVTFKPGLNEVNNKIIGRPADKRKLTDHEHFKSYIDSGIFILISTIQKASISDRIIKTKDTTKAVALVRDLLDIKELREVAEKETRRRVIKAASENINMLTKDRENQEDID